MTYNYEQRRKIRKAIREAQKKSYITKAIEKKLKEAVSIIEGELSLVKGLLHQPVSK